MEEALRTTLLNAAPVASLAGNRVDWGARVQGDATPAVVLHRIGGFRDRTTSGPSGLVESRVQADCWARTYAEAKRLARAVVETLGGFSGGGIMIVHVEGEHDSFDGDGPDPLHRTSLDLMVWHPSA